MNKLCTDFEKKKKMVYSKYSTRELKYSTTGCAQNRIQLHCTVLLNTVLPVTYIFHIVW